MTKQDKSGTFKLDVDYKDKPSYFEFEILINNKLYSYGYEVLIDKNEFVSEWLIELYPEGNDKVIFTRDIQNEKIDIYLSMI